MHLRTLGSFELLETGADGQPIRHLTGQKPLALVAYLAFAPERRATRDRLVALLWGTVDVERARRTLRQTLWVLRQRFGDDALRNDGEEVILAMPLTTDVAQFDAAVAAGNLDAAWAHYAGDFIADFATAGSAGFEHWCDGVRDRLRTEWQRAGVTLAERRLQADRPREAAEIARRLREAIPDEAAHWRLELQALLAAGNRREALAVAQALDRATAELEFVIGNETRSLIDRLRHDATASGLDGERRPKPELVGRERAFATLLQLHRLVNRQQTGQLAVVRGSAGIGKSRLLEEFRQRIGHQGGAIVTIRARPVDRDVPYACVAAVAEALVDLPGALGVSAATTAILVDLAPALSAVYRNASPRSMAPDDVMRQRTLALTELLQCVAEEESVVLVIDDLHWADSDSRQVLASVADRLAAHQVLMIVATRMSGRAWAVPDGTQFVDLGPLAIEHLEALVASMASAEHALLREIASLLHDISGGVPILALAAIDLAIDRRVLQIEDGRWHASSLDSLRRALGSGGVLEKLLADLPSDALALLAALALCGGPLDDEVVRVLAREPQQLRELVTRGLLNQSPLGWEIAHDRLADAVLALVSGTEQDRVREQCGHLLMAAASPTPRTLTLAGRLLQGVDRIGSVQAFRRWMELQSGTGQWRDPMRAALRFLGDAAAPDAAQALADSVRWPVRWWRGYPTLARAAVLLIVSSLGLGGGLSAAGAFEPRVARVELEEIPTSNGFLFDTKPGPEGRWAANYDLPITANFVDKHGGTTRRTPTMARVRLIVHRGKVQLSGQVDRPVLGGRVSFPDLRVVGGGEFHLELTAGDSTLARTRTLFLNSISTPDLVAKVRLLSGRINGQPVDSVRSTIRVGPGELLNGELLMQVTSSSPTAAVLVGAVPFWGDRTNNFVPLQAVAPHADTTYRFALIDATAMRRTLRTPEKPGRYPLVIVQGTETEMRYIASATNWMLGAPMWSDGNDLVDMTPQQLATLRTKGRIEWRWMVPKPGTPMQKQEWLNDLIGTVLEIEVVEPAAR